MIGLLRLVPAAVVAGGLCTWLAVWAGTFYRRKFIASMYVLIGLVYSAVLTGLLGLLIPLNVYILEVIGHSVTDAEIPRISEITLYQGDLAAIAPLSYVITGMERGIWAAAAMIVLALIGIRLAGGIGSTMSALRAAVLNTIPAVVLLVVLHGGPIGLHQFLFDRLVQPPSKSILGFQAESSPPVLGPGSNPNN